MSTSILKQSPLGKITPYTDHYAPELLFPIPRAENRQLLPVHSPLPFKGIDRWYAYELSWLNTKGKPLVAMAQFIFPCDSPCLIESKSFKLYLNSLQQTIFPGSDDETFIAVKNTLIQDLSSVAQTSVKVDLHPVSSPIAKVDTLYGECLDAQDISCRFYEPHPACLQTEKILVSENLYSHLLKSNCPITGQPDWGSVYIQYQGYKINHQGLLQYVVSFRQHNEFHEHCVERIFMDIMQKCLPEKLTVAAFYTRRGGLEINPLRSTEQLDFSVYYKRLARQ